MTTDAVAAFVALRCSAPAVPAPDTPVRTREELWARIRASGGPRCDRPAAYRSPLGNYCEACAPRYAATYLNPAAVLNVLRGGVPAALANMTVAELLTTWRLQ